MRSRHLGLSAALLTLAFTSPLAHAMPGELGVSFEPIIGYERVQKLVPVTRMSNRLIYGGRVTAGFLALSAEAEYTRGSESESVGSNSYESVSDRAKVGLRSGIRVALFTFSLRAGGQASWETSTTVIGSNRTSVVTGPTYAPYGGAEIRAGFGRNFSGSVSAVAVFRDFSNLANTELQTTAGFSVRLP